MKVQVQKAEGRLGILIPVLGAVANTLIARMEAVKKEEAGVLNDADA